RALKSLVSLPRASGTVQTLMPQIKSSHHADRARPSLDPEADEKSECRLSLPDAGKRHAVDDKRGDDESHADHLHYTRNMSPEQGDDKRSYRHQVYEEDALVRPDSRHTGVPEQKPHH